MGMPTKRWTRFGPNSDVSILQPRVDTVVWVDRFEGARKNLRKIGVSVHSLTDVLEVTASSGNSDGHPTVWGRSTDIERFAIIEGRVSLQTDR